ncbi:maleylpyruvate isomerase N-terminal domain-containing protein [Streptomyces sp. NPDC090106]|uniref:maleylpyruvate isomerase N-terminal domain-containing protein n=1 Tax=Streptomyces sp. NPDC090106 TaxID=3365946 RepID=UPI0037F9D7F6
MAAWSLREAGPEGCCWTWWGASQSPRNAAAVARHRVQETTVHTYDMRVTLDDPRPLPEDVAFDGADEFLSTCCATTSAWPHKPTAFDFHAIEGPSWRFAVEADGARSERLSTDTGAEALTLPASPSGARPVN